MIAFLALNAKRRKYTHICNCFSRATQYRFICDRSQYTLKERGLFTTRLKNEAARQHAFVMIMVFTLKSQNIMIISKYHHEMA